MTQEQGMALTEQHRTDLGQVSDAEAVAKIAALAGFDLDGLDLVDVGCGPALVSRELVKLGARVLGVEPDPVQAAKNRLAPPEPGLRLEEGGAERLPLPDNSVDGVLFFRSLHHVPTAHIDAALAEAIRVLKPERGFLCVVEPGMDGSHFAMMRPFHDETLVRNEAQAALGRLSARRLFRHEARYHCVQYPRHESFEQMVAQYTGLSFNNISRDMVDTPQVRAVFDDGKTPQGDYAFEQPVLINFYMSL